MIKNVQKPNFNKDPKKHESAKKKTYSDASDRRFVAGETLLSVAFSRARVAEHVKAGRRDVHSNLNIGIAERLKRIIYYTHYC
jgi:hypothetical protein